MMTIVQVTTAYTLILLIGCNTQSSNSINSYKKDTPISDIEAAAVIDTPRSFVKNYGANDNNQLFVFVGEKKSIERLPAEQNSMDNGFKAKYAIIKKIFGNFPEDSIEFIAYDHYGYPAFSKFKYVLLYVSADSGTYYHQKYMYNDVYKTKDGRWAGTYAASDYNHDFNEHTKIKPIKIEFAVKVAYPTKMIDDDGRKHTLSYPKPYFKMVGDSAFAVYGNYVEDLFKLKRDGFLTAREIFKNGKLVH